MFYEVVYRSSSASAAGTPSSRFEKKSTDLVSRSIHRTKIDHFVVRVTPVAILF